MLYQIDINILFADFYFLLIIAQVPQSTKLVRRLDTKLVGQDLISHRQVLSIFVQVLKRTVNPT